MHWGSGFWHIWPLLWIVFIAIICWGASYWFRQRNRYLPSYPADRPPQNLSALETLRQRYARGEIDAVTFEQMRERLENSGGPQFQ
ncbi:MAG TPA: SHOCT domain-containing protein [Ktedonobacteraceae bacterium]|nr:SHOCT domain-containing protein [Ktedonobacteraceae bacterium]